MEGFRSYPSPSGDIEDLEEQHRRTIQQRRAEQSEAKTRRWKTRQWIAFLAAVVGGALFLFGLNLAVDWPGFESRDVDTNREVVTLDDVRADPTTTEPDSAQSNPAGPAGEQRQP